MQENRSFDHYFGTMKGVRGFADPDALTLSTGKSVFYQPEFVGGLPIGGGFRDAARKPPRLPDDTAEQLTEAKWEVANLPKPTLPKPTLPGADQTPPVQERGRRKRR